MANKEPILTLDVLDVAPYNLDNFGENLRHEDWRYASVYGTVSPKDKRTSGIVSVNSLRAIGVDPHDEAGDPISVALEIHGEKFATTPEALGAHVVFGGEVVAIEFVSTVVDTNTKGEVAPMRYPLAS